MSEYLVPDKLTNGVLTTIIEESRFKKEISPFQMNEINNYLLENDVFEEIAENVFVELGEERSSDPSENIHYFEKKGFIVDDTLHAANGRFRYIYRGKGIRTIWFEDGTISMYSLYATIDGDGFSYSLEEIDCFPTQEKSLIMNNEYNAENIFSVLNGYINANYLFNKLARINKKYNRDYYLEFLLNPPDVLELSNFSMQLKKECWSSVISLANQISVSYSQDKYDFLVFALEFLISAGIEPLSKSLVELIFIIHQNNQINSNKVIQIIKGDKDENLSEGKKINENLIQELLKIESGRTDAKEYEKLMVKISERLFSPDLRYPKSQVCTLDGREIIDITFFNASEKGFWHDIKMKLSAHSVYIECKNMDDLGNEEFHQISNRLSETKGLFGILISRKSDNLDLDRINRILVHQKKVIIVLNDIDIINMLSNFYSHNEFPIYYISQLYRSIIERS